MHVTYYKHMKVSSGIYSEVLLEGNLCISSAIPNKSLSLTIVQIAHPDSKTFFSWLDEKYGISIADNFFDLSFYHIHDERSLRFS